MFKCVAPADPGASIPDPERGHDLPAEGRVVAWSAYWAGHLARGEITASDPVEADSDALQSAPADPAPQPFAAGAVSN